MRRLSRNTSACATLPPLRTLTSRSSFSQLAKRRFSKVTSEEITPSASLPKSRLVSLPLLTTESLRSEDQHAEPRVAGYNSVAQFVQSSDASAARTAVSALKSSVDGLAQERGLSFPFEFQNDAGPTENPLAGYGATNMGKLKAVSNKYDPQQTFQTNQFAGFKISKA